MCAQYHCLSVTLRSGGEEQTCIPGDLHAEILSKMSAKEQMSKMLDQLLGQNRDGEFVHGFVFDSKQYVGGVLCYQCNYEARGLHFCFQLLCFLCECLKTFFIHLLLWQKLDHRAFSLRPKVTNAMGFKYVSYSL